MIAELLLDLSVKVKECFHPNAFDTKDFDGEYITYCPDCKEEITRKVEHARH